ncbi:MAG: hypothetical protein DCC57_08350 [Chloroflexi bacterium]|nr:MAG: hypothetical protein DCC57_08350 [Chloroflexota bacterium]
MQRWLLPLACLVTLAGVFGPWVAHPAAGLVITGLDLGEYVKFLPTVQRGEIWLWRPGFYAPLVCVSATCSLAAYRRDLGYAPWLRGLLLLLALVSALNLLPPAWTPQRLLAAEFRWQTSALVLLLAALGLSPLLALLPRSQAAAAASLAALAALVFPIQGFLAILPAVGALMARPISPAWGMWCTVAGLLALLIAWWQPKRAATPSTIM